MDFKKFSKLNKDRAINTFNNYDNAQITYFGCAIAGEVGELCNLLKKLQRVYDGGIDTGTTCKASDINISMLEEEVGDVFIYLDLICSKMNINLEKSIKETFNKKSIELKSNYII